MCYHTQQRSDDARLKARFRAGAVEEAESLPQGPQSGFDHPRLPVIVAGEPGVVRLMEWGLIPAWATAEQARNLPNQTLNARAEGVFEKASFRESILLRRCLVLVDGFFEWQHEGKQKTKFLLTVRNGEPFALGGLWAEWRDPASGQRRRTFSIVTTEANPLMAQIHNTKQRMPLMLLLQHEAEWLDLALTPGQVARLMVPFPESAMRAEPLFSKTPGGQMDLFAGG